MPTAEQLVRDIRRAQAVGEDARELKAQLWLCCADVVHKLAACYTRGRPHLHEDFVSEAYLKFEQALAGYDLDRGVPFHLFLRHCVDRLYQDMVGRRGERPVEVPEEAAAGVDLLTLLRNEELARQVDALLQTLLPRDRQRERKLQAFRLRHLHGWQIDEIRARLGARSNNLVSQWICRVGKAFEAEFARRYPEYFEGRCCLAG